MTGFKIHDKQQLTDDLAKLPRVLLMTFAAACAQRLLPNYLRYASAARHAKPAAMSNALAGLWSMIESCRFDEGVLAKDYDLCLSLIDDANNNEAPRREYIQGGAEAEDAVLAIAYAIRARNGDPEEGEAAAEQAINAIDSYLTQRHEVDLDDKEWHQKLEAHPIMQMELRRRHMDLAELLAAARNPGGERAVIERIQRRAEMDAVSLW